MKAIGIHHVKDRDLFVSVEEPLEKLSVGWMVGYGLNIWQITAVDIVDSRVVGIFLVPIKGEKYPGVGTVFEKFDKITYTLSEFVKQAKKDLDDYEKDWSGLNSNTFHGGVHTWIEWWKTWGTYFSWEER